MRVGLFTDTYTPDINGVVTSIVTLKKALENEGHTVYVVTNQPSILNTNYENHVLRLPGLELKFLYGYVLSSPLHIQAMSAIEEMNLDVIHVHSEFGIGMFARIVAKNLHLPLVSTYHTTYEDYTHYINLLGLKSVDQISRKMVAKMSRTFTKQAQLIIAPSEKTKKMLLGYEIRKEIAVVPTGLDLSRFENRDHDAINQIRDDYHLKDSFTFVYIGRLAKEKSIDVVIDAIALLHQNMPNIRLLIVGGGPSEDELKAQAVKRGIGECVLFVGPVDASQVVNYYHAADAFISASLTETQGLTYIEALACGLCVFARPDKPLEGIIVDDETGYLFENEAMFAEKAAAFINGSTENRARLKNNALQLVKSFDSSVFAKRVLSVYQRAIDTYFGKYTVMNIVSIGEEIGIDYGAGAIEERIIISEYVFERREIKVGDEMSRNELNEIEDDQAIYEAYQMALARIGVRDYSSYEMSEFLREKLELSQSQIDVVIDLLKRRRFIDDDRYFRDKIDYHRSQMRGNQRIVDDMKKRGFEADRILMALEDEDYNDYTERGIQRAEMFMKTLTDGSTRQRESKVRQHLQRQGYNNDIVSDIIARVMDHDYTEEQEFESLKAVLSKAKVRYSRRYDERETKNRMVRYALTRGYNYDMIARALEALENDED